VYVFAASDGTVCQLTLSHSTTARANGNWDIGWDASIPCPVSYAEIGADLMGGPPNYPIWGAPFTQSSRCGGSRPCGWAIYAGSYTYDVPDNEYTHTARLVMTLSPPSSSLDPPKVWVAAPVGCLPGGASVGCTVTESFTPQ
jgi:hypothetical protein